MPHGPADPPRRRPDPATKPRAAAGLALVLAAVLCATPAVADLQAARDAIVAGDSAAALEELAAPELETDPVALILRGQMTAAGDGAPADPVAAYALFTRAMMSGGSEQWIEAAYWRRDLARGMSDAQILDGEAQVLAWLDGRPDAASRVARLASLPAELETCEVRGGGCDDMVLAALRFGPAAADAVPALEALMTRDPMWSNRDFYAVALITIGKAAAPALARVMLDETQLRTEGAWNASLAAKALGDLGPAARAQLPDLLRAASLSSDDISAAWDQMAEQLAGQADMAFQIRLDALIAVQMIGDPDRTIRASLLERAQTSPDLASAILFGLTIGLIYGEAQPALDLVRRGLDSPDQMTRRLAVGAISDFAGRPELRAAVAPLEPLVRELASDPDPDISAFARLALEGMAEAPAGE